MADTVAAAPADKGIPKEIDSILRDGQPTFNVPAFASAIRKYSSGIPADTKDEAVAKWWVNLNRDKIDVNLLNRPKSYDKDYALASRKQFQLPEGTPKISAKAPLLEPIRKPLGDAIHSIPSKQKGPPAYEPFYQNKTIENVRHWLLGINPSDPKQVEKSRQVDANLNDFTKGFTEGMVDVGVDMTSPANLAMMFATFAKGPGKLAKKFPKLVAMAKAGLTGKFTIDSFKGVLDEVPEAKKAFGSGDREAAGKAIAKGMADLFFGLSAAEGTMREGSRLMGGKAPGSGFLMDESGTPSGKGGGGGKPAESAKPDKMELTPKPVEARHNLVEARRNLDILRPLASEVANGYNEAKEAAAVADANLLRKVSGRDPAELDEATKEEVDKLKKEVELRKKHVEEFLPRIKKIQDDLAAAREAHRKAVEGAKRAGVVVKKTAGPKRMPSVKVTTPPGDPDSPGSLRTVQNRRQAVAEKYPERPVPTPPDSYKGDGGGDGGAPPPPPGAPPPGSPPPGPPPGPRSGPRAGGPKPPSPPPSRPKGGGGGIQLVVAPEPTTEAPKPSVEVKPESATQAKAIGEEYKQRLKAISEDPKIPEDVRGRALAELNAYDPAKFESNLGQAVQNFGPDKAREVAFGLLEKKFGSKGAPSPAPLAGEAPTSPTQPPSSPAEPTTPPAAPPPAPAAAEGPKPQASPTPKDNLAPVREAYQKIVDDPSSTAAQKDNAQKALDILKKQEGGQASETPKPPATETPKPEAVKLNALEEERKRLTEENERLRKEQGAALTPEEVGKKLVPEVRRTAMKSKAKGEPQPQPPATLPEAPPTVRAPVVEMKPKADEPPPSRSGQPEEPAAETGKGEDKAPARLHMDNAAKGVLEAKRTGAKRVIVAAIDADGNIIAQQEVNPQSIDRKGLEPVARALATPGAVKGRLIYPDSPKTKSEWTIGELSHQELKGAQKKTGTKDLVEPPESRREPPAAPKSAAPTLDQISQEMFHKGVGALSDEEYEDVDSEFDRRYEAWEKGARPEGGPPRPFEPPPSRETGPEPEPQRQRLPENKEQARPTQFWDDETGTSNFAEAAKGIRKRLKDSGFTQMLWVKVPGKGVIFTDDYTLTHANWFHKMGLPSSGKEFDSLERGFTEINLDKRSVSLSSYQGNFVPNEVVEVMRDYFPESKGLDWNDMSHNWGDSYKGNRSASARRRAAQAAATRLRGLTEGHNAER